MAQHDGELAWPQRFGAQWVKDMEYEQGQYAFAGQYQQSPTPRKGGILKREYWQYYVPPTEGRHKGAWPELSYVIVSLDSAFTEKEENDPSGCTTWGIWTDPEDGFPKVMLLDAWRKHLPIHGEDQEVRGRKRAMPITTPVAVAGTARAISVQPTFAQHLVYSPRLSALAGARGHRTGASCLDCEAGCAATWRLRSTTLPSHRTSWDV
jgi:hypothetical protein